jgi:hypothetical protein
MKAHELAQRLLKGPNHEIMILDSFNGEGGYPREINFGPITHTVTADEAEESGDCEEIVGQEIMIMGYGFY